MAATESQGRVVITRIAADALTKGVPCFYSATAGKVTATTVGGSTGITSFMAGIPLDNYTAGQEAEICIFGVCPVKIATGASINVGTPIQVTDASTSGAVSVCLTGNLAIGVAIDPGLATGTAATDGDLRECFVMPGMYYATPR